MTWSMGIWAAPAFIGPAPNINGSRIAADEILVRNRLRQMGPTSCCDREFNSNSA
jgi:hypothetical protein